jgi:hypothetical protein
MPVRTTGIKGLVVVVVCSEDINDDRTRNEKNREKGVKENCERHTGKNG